MAKTNIKFNNTTYQVDESTLASATAELRTHLSTTMAGTGATIELGGTTYNVDSAKLSTATNDFISHLGKIAGNGTKVKIGNTEYSIDSTKLTSAISDIEDVLAGTGEERLEGDGAEFYTLAPTALSFRSTAPLNELQEIQINGVTVDPSNYTLEEGSTIVTFPIDYLKTLNVGNYEVAVASESKTVKGDFSVKAPELNEHGFYYNQPYVGYVSYYNQNWVFFLREDGTMDFMILEDGYTETCNYEMVGNNITVNGIAGTFTGSVGATEIYCNEVATTFVLGDTSITADEDYIYIYKEDLGGYEVSAIDKTKAEYGAIKTGINGIDTVKLSDEMFSEHLGKNYTLNVAPKIPDSVTDIGDSAFYGCINMTSVTIGNGVVTIGDYAFNDCFTLTSIVIPDGVTTIGDYAFDNCKSLISVTIGNGVSSIGRKAFCYGERLTTIIFRGTIAQWNAINKGTDWNHCVPATYVQCSDGQVAL